MSTPIIRGSGIQSGSMGSVVVSFPAGSVAGDLALVFGSAAYTSYVPSGWTAPLSTVSAGSTWRSIFFYKILNSSDIATGSVTVSIGGTYDVVFGIATFVGNPGPVRVASQSN